MVSPTTSQNTSSPAQQSSAVFVINALEKVASAREAKRSKPLKEAVDTALSKVFLKFFLIKLLIYVIFLYRNVEE